MVWDRLGAWVFTSLHITISPNGSPLNKWFCKSYNQSKILTRHHTDTNTIAIKYNLKKCNSSNKAFLCFLWQNTIIINLICCINIICEVLSGSNLHNLKIILFQHADVPSRHWQLQYGDSSPRKIILNVRRVSCIPVFFHFIYINEGGIYPLIFKNTFLLKEDTGWPL